MAKEIKKKLNYRATQTMTGTIRNYKSNECSTKKGYMLASFVVHVGENAFTVSCNHNKSRLTPTIKDGKNVNEKYIEMMENIKEASDEKSSQLFEVITDPYYRKGKKGSDTENKVYRTPNLRYLGKNPSDTEGSTFLVRGIVNTVRKNTVRQYTEVELGFVNADEKETYITYEFVTVFIPDEVEFDDDIISVGNYVTIAGEACNCYKKDKYGHVEGDSKTGLYAEVVYDDPSDYIDSSDIDEDEAKYYANVKKVGLIDNREAAKTATASTSKPKVKAKATRKYEEEPEEEVQMELKDDEAEEEI